MSNLRVLPKVRDSISFAYFDRCRIEQEAKAIAVFQEQDKYLIPCASISTLLLGPGSTITHAAVKALADNACTVQWVGEEALRFYSSGQGSAGNTTRLYHQATLWASSERRLEVVRRMYTFRFDEKLNENLTLQQIRGLEGVRVRTAYSQMSKSTGIAWKGRDYKTDSWDSSDPINRALSAANSCLYAVCQAAIVAVSYSPALGFIHTGKPLSFVYDIADLYKTTTTIPAAFECVAQGEVEVERAVRAKCREKFSTQRLMRRIVDDIDRILGFGRGDSEPETQCQLWDDQLEWVEGGRNWSEEVTQSSEA